MPEKTAQLSIRTTAVRKANLKRLARKEGRSVDDMLAYHFKLDHGKCRNCELAMYCQAQVQIECVRRSEDVNHSEKRGRK